MKLLGWCAAVAAMGGVCAEAQVAEVRFGVAEFSEDFLNPGTERDNGVEQSVALQGEVVFEEPGFLKWALSPQPYINVTANLEQNTSLAGAGLLWRQEVGDRFYADFAAGASVHDGELEFGLGDFLPEGELTAAQFDTAFDQLFAARRRNREFGSRVLIRAQATVGVRVSEDWAAEVFFEHHSNGSGSLFNRDPGTFLEAAELRENDAVDTLGLRAARRF